MPHWFNIAWHWFEVKTGTSNESGPYYGFWSGFGSDLGEVTLFGVIIAGYRKINCHSKGCWRIGHHDHEQDGVTYKLCRICHPGITKRLRRHHFKVHAQPRVRP